MGAIASRSYLSLTHLLSADLFVYEAMKLESSIIKPKNRILGLVYIEREYSLHRSYIIASVFSSVAFLEATINEIYQDVYEGGETGYTSSFNVEQKNSIKDYWEENTKKRRMMIDKYNQLLMLTTGKPLNKGKEPSQSLKIILDIRNEMTHYTPNWVSHTENHKYESLIGKFERNKHSYHEDPFFPDQLLSADFGKWVLTTCKKFADEFFLDTKIEPTYQSLKLRSI